MKRQIAGFAGIGMLGRAPTRLAIERLDDGKVTITARGPQLFPGRPAEEVSLVLERADWASVKAQIVAHG